MALESGTYISDLVATNPVTGDQLSQSDDHHRWIKSAILASFPNITGAMTATHAILNGLDGRVTAIEDDYVRADGSDPLTGAWDASGATWSDLGAVTTADIDGGSIDGTVIGAAVAAVGTFAALVCTTLSATGAAVFGSTVLLNANPTLDLQAATKIYVDDARALLYSVDGLNISHAADTDHDLTVAAGSITDTTRAKMLVLTSAITKQIDAPWVVGTDAGGLDTGSVAIDTWYHQYLIMRSDTGVVDVLFSTSATAPTMPTNYDYKQRIGARLTDGSGNFIPTHQIGSRVYWNSRREDLNTDSPSTTGESTVLSVPPGVINQAQLNVSADVGSPSAYFLVTALAGDNEEPSETNHDIGTDADNVRRVTEMLRPTNTSGEVRYRSSDPTVTFFRIRTLGWTDPRGEIL